MQTLREQLDFAFFLCAVCAEGEAIQHLLQFRFQLRDLLKRSLQSDQIARVTGGLAQSADRTLNIADRFQFRPNRVEQVRLLQKIGNHLLAAAELGQITERLQNPGAQFARPHRRHRSIENRKQTGVARASGFDQFEIGLRRCIEQHIIARCIAPQRTKMIDFAAKLVLQVMNNCACGGDRLRHLRAAKTVQRFYLEMFAQGEARVFRQERIAVVLDRVIDLAQRLFLLGADQQLRW